MDSKLWSRSQSYTCIHHIWRKVWSHSPSELVRFLIRIVVVCDSLATSLDSQSKQPLAFHLQYRCHQSRSYMAAMTVEVSWGLELDV